jgi:dynein heavy chain
MFTAGCDSKPIVFLFSDTQIIRESFVEDINNILNSGEVPDLFLREDVDKIMETCRPLAKAAGKPESKDAVFGHFIQLVRENLHIVFTMSPIGDGFRNRLRMFPSLVNCMTIDWFSEWPEDALVSVAEKFLGEVEMQSDVVKAGVIKMCNVIHQSIAQKSEDFYDELRRKNYTTPTSYMELINLYQSMLAEARKANFMKSSRLSGGLTKLTQTNVLVEGLKKDLTELQPTLDKAAKDTAELLVKVPCRPCAVPVRVKNRSSLFGLRASAGIRFCAGSGRPGGGGQRQGGGGGRGCQGERRDEGRGGDRRRLSEGPGRGAARAGCRR